VALYGKPKDEGFKLALAADLSLPTGSASDFTGDNYVSFRPRLIAGFEQDGWTAAVNAGYAARRQRAIATGNLTVDDQIIGGLLLGYAVIPARLWALGETYFSHVLGENGGVRDTPLEALAGARYALPGPWMIQGGLGFGLTTGAGCAHGARPRLDRLRDGHGTAASAAPTTASAAASPAKEEAAAA
jgi:hypothetical protein